MALRIQTLGLAALAMLAATSASAADANIGKAAFKTKCATCHAIGGAGAEIGPDLAGVVGRKAAAQPDFAYSAALKRGAIVWDAATLRAFLVKPASVAPGSRMAYPGTPPTIADDLVAYLSTVK